MNAIKLTIAFLLMAAVGVGHAWADSGHRGHRDHRGHLRVVIGANWGPFSYPPYYYYPPYYPRVVVVRPAPQVYIEQQPAPAAPIASAPVNYWYYCAAAQGYYPYVPDCPGGWQRVLPRPPGQQ